LDTPSYVTDTLILPTLIHDVYSLQHLYIPRNMLETVRMTQSTYFMESSEMFLRSKLSRIHLLNYVRVCVCVLFCL